MKLMFLPLLFSFVCNAQNEVTRDTYKPYLLHDTSLTAAFTIEGGNTFSLNKRLGETDVDTIYCLIFVADDSSGIRWTSPNTGIEYHPECYFKGYGLWVRQNNPNREDHWDLYDDKFRLVSELKVTVSKIIELRTVTNKRKY